MGDKHHRYYDASKTGSFGGVKAFAKASGISTKEAKEFLKNQAVYTLHKPIRKNFKTRKTIALGIDELWQVDLVDLQKFRRQNRAYNYILTCVDVFSKRAQAVPVKTKTAANMLKAFKILFKHRHPSKLQSDEGREFFNKTLKVYFASKNVHHYHSYGNTKASLIERFNRTLKDKMWRYFTHKGNHEWLKVLPRLIVAYNASFHRTIGMAPNLVTKRNESDLFEKMFGNLPKAKYKFKVGDHVRVSKMKHKLIKGYLQSWSDEIFLITQCIKSYPPTYKIKDLLDEPILGSFYEQELQSIEPPSEWRIEKVIRRRKRGNTTEYFVKWQGFPTKFNSWTTHIRRL